MAREYLNETGLASLWAKIVNKINALGDLCVKKAGDTMTGTLNITNNNLVTSTTAIKTDTIPSSNIYGKGIQSESSDKNSNVHLILGQYATSGTIFGQLEAFRKVSGTNYYNTVHLEIDSSGNKSVGLSDPIAWANALKTYLLDRRGYGSISSDKNLNDYKTTGTFWLNGTSPTNAPFANIWGIMEVYCYSNNAIMLQKITQVGASGITQNAAYVRFYINNAWQAWQRNDPYYEEATGISGCISANNTNTINYIKCVRIGRTVTCTFHFSNNTEKTGELAWVVLKSQFRPSETIKFPVNIVGNAASVGTDYCHTMYLYTDGTMKMWISNSNAKVSQVFGSVSYCIN